MHLIKGKPLIQSAKKCSVLSFFKFGAARTQLRRPKIMRPNQPQFAEVAAVSWPKCNGRPPTGRAPFMIRASPKLSSVVIWDSAPDPRRGLHLLSFKFGELTLVH
ncbi:hypothetical protein TNIN_207851 [Trichonephila inaurata madagascariensis]|uniref:Uncharacterized protein n=1 Tax=Trichonephila inaurata madagascariensis TaxID=2747483 RepID=A0A8X7BRG9_9ARAC|nr:hypothetical protein TNIN_207851 [Trichonephila inaurata madagascariensis]